tara:strand:+ start:1092 stop:1673 length:582 start_codon:yes stop_codon:yes gene_type:complete
MHRDRESVRPALSTSPTARDYLTVPDQATSLTAAEHPKIIEFVQYLSRRCGTDGIPDRSHINPAEILPLLPHMMILDIVDDGEDFRVRVFGTGLVTLLGEERTGMLASEFGAKSIIANDFKEMRSRWLAIFRKALTENGAAHFKAPTVSPDRSYMHYHGMITPITNGTDKISQLVGMMIAVVSDQVPTAGPKS